MQLNFVRPPCALSTECTKLFFTKKSSFNKAKFYFTTELFLAKNILAEAIKKCIFQVYDKLKSLKISVKKYISC